MNVTLRVCLMCLSLLSLRCAGSDQPVVDPTPQAGAGAVSGAAPSLAGGPALGGGGASAGTSDQAGAAGAPQSAGAGGIPAAAGAAGAAGGMVTPGPSGPSAGCKLPDPNEAPQTWLERKITVANLPADQVAMFGDRTYYVRLPVTYDHTKAYPVVFYGPGCGASHSEDTPMMASIKSDAIHVFLLQKSSCFSTGSYPSPEVPYFNQALDEVQAKYCTDAGRVFVSGFSSGAWLSNVLACASGNRIRAIGTAAGGLNHGIVAGYKCPGDTAPGATPAAAKANLAGIFFTGANDTTNKAVSTGKDGLPNGVDAARDRLIAANGCDASKSKPWVNTFGADFCKIWKTGCPNAPVIYCVGPGVGHDNGSSLKISSKGFWEFWSSLP